MSNEPPLPNAPYYRGEATHLDPHKLQMLADGYFGLNWVFLLNVALVVGARFWIQDSESLEVWGIAVSILFTIVTLASLRPNKKIGEGLGWAPYRPIVVSILMGITSAFCCGTIGYMVMQKTALNAMFFTYGIRSGPFGVRRKVINERIREIERGQAFVPPSVS